MPTLSSLLAVPNFALNVAAASDQDTDQFLKNSSSASDQYCIDCRGTAFWSFRSIVLVFNSTASIVLRNYPKFAQNKRQISATSK
jgi:hypothetical protein